MTFDNKLGIALLCFIVTEREAVRDCFCKYNTHYLPQVDLREREKFLVNFSYGEKYRKSAIPNCQRQLNHFAAAEKGKQKQRDQEWSQWMAGLEERLRRRRQERAGQGDMGDGAAGV